MTCKCINLFSPLTIMIIIMMTGIYLHILADLAQEIATSPTFMEGCPAQPRVGTQKC